jgi:amino acid transporter
MMSLSQPKLADGAGIPAAERRYSLRRDYLSFLEVVSQSIATVAPSGTPALVIPVVFAAAGNGTWLAYLFATVALLLVSWNINVFARRTATPGALYAYAGQGLGPLLGVITGWSLVIAYVFTAGAVISGFVNYALVLVHLVGLTSADAALGAVLAVLSVAAAWWLAWRDIRLSTRAMLIIEFVTVALIILVVVGYFFVSGNWVDRPQIVLADVNFESLRLGLVLAFFSFVGFESATALGHEARRPLRVIPRAVIVSVLFIGILFVVSSYGLVGLFRGSAEGLASAAAPLSTAAERVNLAILGPVIAAGVSLSFFACTLASINAGARVLYAMSRHGLVHASAGMAHRANATPHVAVTVAAAVALALSLAITATGAGPLENFSYLGTIATYGFLLAYILVSLAAPFLLRRRGELRWPHVLVSLLSILLLLLPLFGSVYPVPPAPFNDLPYVFLGLLLVGVGYFLWLRLSDPARLSAIEQDLEQDLERGETAADAAGAR